MSLKQLWTSFCQALFPINCLGCNKEGQWLCQECFKNIRLYPNNHCPLCNRRTKGNHLCQTCSQRSPLTGILAACFYQKPADQLIGQLKFFRTKEIAPILAKIMLRRITSQLPEGDKVIIPVPLHKERLRERGFNQADLIAQHLARKLKIPCQDNLLIRQKETKPQTKLNRPERIKNLKDAFSLKRAISLKGKKILLVDDVLTTGTTLSEAAKALQVAQPDQIWGIVVAKR